MFFILLTLVLISFISGVILVLQGEMVFGCGIIGVGLVFLMLAFSYYSYKYKKRKEKVGCDDIIETPFDCMECGIFTKKKGLDCDDCGDCDGSPDCDCTPDCSP